MEAEDAASGGWSIELWLSPGDEQVFDGELQRRIWEEIAWEPEIQDADLQVEVSERVTRLTGTVAHYCAKVAVERAARRVEGLRGVVNEIRVLPRPPFARSDAELLAEATRALEWNALVPSGGIALRVKAGVVRLQGEVALECERVAAIEAVGRLAAVTDVVNEIVVKPTARAGQLQDRVADALRHEHARRITAETLGATVVLHGRVRSLAERDRLEHAVWCVTGVAAVWDEIEVRV